jgi:hypothetical protein
MNEYKNNLLLDRALITDLLLNVKRSTATESHVLMDVARYYERLLYEPSNISALQNIIHSIGEVSDKLVARDFDTTLDEDEAELIRKTVDVGCENLSIIQAIQAYETKRQGPSRPYKETLGYVIRLLISARNLEADIAPWPARANIFKAIFEEAGIKNTTIDITPELKLFRTEKCTFPYLPERQSDASNYDFGLLLFETGASTSNPSTDPQRRVRPTEDNP